MPSLRHIPSYVLSLFLRQYRLCLIVASPQCQAGSVAAVFAELLVPEPFLPHATVLEIDADAQFPQGFGCGGTLH